MTFEVEGIMRRRINLGTFDVLDQRIALRYARPGMTFEEAGH